MAIQWHAVFDDALRSSDVIAVWAAVERLLGRAPTTAELSAARRAANRYAAISNVQLVRIRAPLGGRGPRMVLLLARADADLSDSDHLLDVAMRRPARAPHQGWGTRNVPQRAESLVSALTKSAKTARMLSASQLEPMHAAILADEVAAALPELVALQHRLRFRGGQADTDTRRG